MSTRKRLPTETKEDEIPLFYVDHMSGNMICITYMMNDNNVPIKNKYLFIEKSKSGKVVKEGRVDGLRKVDDLRNDLIRAGWKFWLPPRIDLKGKDAHLFTRKERRAIEKAEKKVAKKKEPVRRGGETLKEFKERARDGK